MEKIQEYNNNFVNQTKSELHQKDNIKIDFNSKAGNYFDYIYSYPPKIQIKWDGLDELNEDLLIGSNYGVLEHSIPFIDFIDDWFFSEATETAILEKYPTSKYLDGILEKINSSNFFFKKTKEIQNALTNIPIFVVLNGQNEIVLSKPSNNLASKGFQNYLKEKIYDSSGAFDLSVEKKSELGLFFMSYQDAEKYLKEFARYDFEGTQTVGLSIHCISLNSAYKITREHHPGTDFRFIPNLKEVKELLRNNIGKADMIVEDEQQQLRFRRRNSNLFPYLNKLGKFLSPTSSFLQRNEYFKGVPIYIVQIQETPRNLFVEQYFNLIGYLDTIYNTSIQFLDSTIGFGHNWIIQGSLQNVKHSKGFESYIFFDKEQAVKFTKTNGRKVTRFSGGRTSNLEFMVRKPKIFIFNLEDFLEDWEDKILGELNGMEDNKNFFFTSKAINFIPPNFNTNEADIEFRQTFVTNLTQALNVKFKVFKKSIGIFFSIN